MVRKMVNFKLRMRESDYLRANELAKERGLSFKQYVYQLFREVKKRKFLGGT